MGQILHRFEVLDHIDADRCVGAVQSKAGIVVKQPWGVVGTKKVQLAAGWYVTEIGGDSPCAIIQYKNHDNMDFLEVSLEAGKPVYLSLEGGEYSATVLAGGRPASYFYRSINLRRLSWLEVGFFFAKRGFELLKDAKFAELNDRLNLTIARQRGFGAVADKKHAGNCSFSNSYIGPLARRDIVVGGFLQNDPMTATRLCKLSNGPTFSIHIIGKSTRALHSVQHQIYPRWVVGSVDPQYFHVYVHADDTLTPDALLVFAEAISKNSQTALFYSDGWINGVPSAQPAFDVFLHKNFDDISGLIVTKGLREKSLSSYDANLIELISVPLFHSQKAAVSQICEDNTVTYESTKISVIIPTRDRGDLLKNCIGSLNGMHGVDDIIVVDNGSVEQESLLIFEELIQMGVRIIADNGDFNFSRLCNFGALSARNSILAFVNNDIEFIDKNSLAEMARYSQYSSIGPVGTLLLYSDDTVQHAGVAVGLSGAAGHPWRHATLDTVAKEPSLKNVSQRSAVTAACMVIEARKFWLVGGFDQVRYPVTLNDIDLCLRLSDEGFESLYVPKAVAYHLEGISRGLDETGSKKLRRIAEMQEFGRQWSGCFERERWLSPMYSRGSELIRLR